MSAKVSPSGGVLVQVLVVYVQRLSLSHRSAKVIVVLGAAPENVLTSPLCQRGSGTPSSLTPPF